MNDVETLQSIFSGMQLNFGIFMLVLAVFIATDFVTGILKAYKNEKKISSSKLRDGGFKKAGIVLTVVLGFCLSKLFSDENYLILHCVQAYYIYTEFISILENLEAMDIDIPKIFKKILGDIDGNSH
ncbi:MAG: phage holin family protein [Firmicutes bacterium]|nr:phage holin family protein [Bacillota bacterium]